MDSLQPYTRTRSKLERRGRTEAMRRYAVAQYKEAPNEHGRACTRKHARARVLHARIHVCVCVCVCVCAGV